MTIKQLWQKWLQIGRSVPATHRDSCNLMTSSHPENEDCNCGRHQRQKDEHEAYTRLHQAIMEMER